MLSSQPFSASISSTFQFLFAIIIAVIVGLIAFPSSSWAQVQEPPNFCTVLEQSPRTSGAKSSLGDEWNASNDSWEPQTRTIQTFDGSTLTELLFQERNVGTWRDTSRATLEYDGEGRLDLCTLENTNQQGNFVNAFRIGFQYNTGGNIDVRLTERWDTSGTDEWVNFVRSTFEYDENGNDTLKVVEAWEPESQMWFDSQRLVREYDNQGRITLEREEKWDPLAQSWQNDQRTQFTYETNATVAVEETWDGSSWVNDERRTTSLNSSGLPIETLVENWDGSDWVNDERGTKSYTTHDNTQKFERQVVEDWDAAGNVWVNDRRTRYSYTDVIPVELVRFEAQRSGEDVVRLTWQTASETNNSGFEVQRRVSDASAPGARQTESGTSSWTTVHFAEGTGTTPDPQFYQFTDQGVPYEAETIRYRLKQVDLDGTTHLSGAVEVRLGAPDELALRAPFPNPSKDQATVRYELPEATDVQVAVYDLLGRQVVTLVDGRKMAGRAQVRLRTGGLPSGAYILRLQASEQTRTQRFTVVK